MESGRKQQTNKQTWFCIHVMYPGSGLFSPVSLLTPGNKFPFIHTFVLLPIFFQNQSLLFCSSSERSEAIR